MNVCLGLSLYIPIGYAGQCRNLLEIIRWISKKVTTGTGNRNTKRRKFCEQLNIRPAQNKVSLS